MTVCVHGKVCREYINRGNKILCVTCPNGCPYFEEKRDDKIALTAQQLGDIVTDALMSAGRYRGGLR